MSSNDHIQKDDRFKHISKDPRFRRMRKDDQKVKIDNRFKDMFKDKRFSDQAEIDKRGRPVQQGGKKSDLKRYYRVSESEDEDDDDDDDEDDEDEKAFKASSRKPMVDRADEPDFARGEGLESSSSESEEEVDEGEGEEEDGIDLSQAWGELDHDAETGQETFRRLALCNMDWDRIKAVDILVLCNSFAPKEGTIESVTILPSEFGKERMKEEDFSGPSELRKSTSPDDENDDDDPDAAAVQQRKLRQYQLTRLKYFYAVIVCDSVSTAEKVYADLDGHDYESSGTKLDLRFIPDDMTFDDDPKEVCTSLPSADSVYEPEAFVTKALHQSKVECTWDETDRERTRVTRRKFNKEEMEALDLKDYLASSSSEDEGVGGDDVDGKPMTNESRIEIYRKLLQGIENDEEGERKKKLKAGEVQVTFEPGLKEKAEKLVQEKLSGKTESTAKNKKDKAKKKKKEVEVEDEDDDIPDGIDLNDPYFAEELAEAKAGGSKQTSNETTMKKKKKKLKKKKGKGSKDTTEEEEKETEALRLLLSDDEEDGENNNNKKNKKTHFDMKKIVKKEGMSKKKQKKLEKEGEKKKEDNFDIDLNDARFSAVVSDPNFNIDQSNPNFKRTKSSVALLNNKIKKRNLDGELGNEGGGKKKKKKVR